MRYAIDSNAVLQIAHQRPRPARRASSRQPDPSGVREARAVPAGRREGEEAPGGGGVPERHRRRDRLPARAGLGAARRAGAWWSSGRRRASASRSTSCPRRSTGKCGPRCRSASPTWAHRPLGIMVLALAYRTGVPWNESQVFQPGVRPLARPGGGHAGRRLAPRDHGQARGDPAGRRPDRAAGVAGGLHLPSTSGCRASGCTRRSTSSGTSSGSPPSPGVTAGRGSSGPPRGPDPFQAPAARARRLAGTRR